MPETKTEEVKKKPKSKPVGFHRTLDEIYELGFDGTFSYFICYDFSRADWRKVIEIEINENLTYVPLHDPLVEKRAAAKAARNERSLSFTLHDVLLRRIFCRRGEWKGIWRPGRWHRRSEPDAFHQH